MLVFGTKYVSLALKVVSFALIEFISHNDKLFNIQHLLYIVQIRVW